MHISNIGMHMYEGPCITGANGPKTTPNVPQFHPAGALVRG